MALSSIPSGKFPERLREARERRDLNQAELARRAKFQASAISHFETGSRRPSLDNLKRLADALEVTTDYLIGRVDEMKAVGPMDEFYRHYSQLSSADQEFARHMIATLAKKQRSK